jgi:hypothetical protein
MPTPSAPVRERERLYSVFVSVSTFKACPHFLLSHTLFTSKGEREKEEREREKEKKGGRERGRKREKEGERGRERERKRQRCRIVISIFKRNDRCLGTF